MPLPAPIATTPGLLVVDVDGSVHGYLPWFTGRELRTPTGDWPARRLVMSDVLEGRGEQVTQVLAVQMDAGDARELDLVGPPAPWDRLAALLGSSSH